MHSVRNFLFLTDHPLVFVPYKLGETPTLPADTQFWYTFGTYFSPETLNAWPGEQGVVFVYESEFDKYPGDKLAKHIVLYSSLPSQTHIKAVWKHLGGRDHELPRHYRLLDERNRIRNRAPEDSPAGHYHLALNVEKALTVESLIKEDEESVSARIKRGKNYAAVVESQNQELAKRAVVFEIDGVKIALLDGLLNLGTLGYEACRQRSADVAILTRHDYPAGLLRFSSWTRRADLDLVKFMTDKYGHLPGFRAGGQDGNCGGSVALSSDHPFAPMFCKSTLE